MSESDSLTTRPHPTIQAFTPVDLRFGLGMSVFLAVVAILGVLRWLFPRFVLSTGRTAENFDLVLYTAPFWCFPAAIYFMWRTWREWRSTRVFNAQRQSGHGTIIDLWIERPDEDSGTRVYKVGYRYGEGAEACQTVSSKRYNRLSLGDEVTVEYVPGRPDLSRMAEPPGRTRKKKQADDEDDE